MKSIWKNVQAQAEAYQKAGTPSCLCTKKAIPRMTKAEALSLMDDAIETINGFRASIRAIPGSGRDPECRAQIDIYSKHITRCLNEINLYKSATDEKFEDMFPTTALVTLFEAMPRLEQACLFFAQRGARYNPPR